MRKFIFLVFFPTNRCKINKNNIIANNFTYIYVYIIMVTVRCFTRKTNKWIFEADLTINFGTCTDNSRTAKLTIEWSVKNSENKFHLSNINVFETSRKQSGGYIFNFCVFFFIFKILIFLKSGMIIIEFKKTLCQILTL